MFKKIDSFDYATIAELPCRLEEHLGKEFITQLNKYNRAGLNSLQLKKLDKKSHPLCQYWQPLKQCIAESKQEQKLKLNEQTIFLVNIYFTLSICRSVKNIQVILSKLKKKGTFYSSCHELEVARYYIELGHQVDAIPETKNKTPDLKVTTKQNEILYAEAKLIEDLKQKEDSHWTILKSNIDKILQKHKKSLQVHLIALAPLTDIDQVAITKFIENYCKDHSLKGGCTATSKNLKIEIKKICDWNHEVKDELNFPDVGDLCSTIFSGVKKSDAFYISNIRNITVTKFTKIDIQKSIRKNIEKANKQAIVGFPLNVHVGLPNKKSKEILDITDFVQGSLIGDINRNFEKINAIIIQASSIETNSKALHPLRSHKTIVPNFKSKNELPNSFKFSAYDTLESDSLTSNGSVELGYYGNKLQESMENDGFGEMFFICSNNAKSQMRLVLTSKNTLRLQLVSPQFHYRNFDISISTKELISGSKVKFKWDDHINEVFIDDNLIFKETILT